MKDKIIELMSQAFKQHLGDETAVKETAEAQAKRMLEKGAVEITEVTEIKGPRNASTGQRIPFQSIIIKGKDKDGKEVEQEFGGMLI